MLFYMYIGLVLINQYSFPLLGSPNAQVHINPSPGQLLISESVQACWGSVQGITDESCC